MSRADTRATPPRSTRVRPARSRVTWALGYGMAGTSFRRAAAQGDPIARIETDRALQLDPWRAFADLRVRGPVVPGAIAYATVSHEAVTTILRSDAFGTGGGHRELPTPIQRFFSALHDPWASTVVDPPSMLATDGSQHARYRKLVSRAFTARAVTGLEDRIQDVADRLLDRLEAQARAGVGGFDLVEDYAARLPVAVIADMLGVPDDMHDKLLAWGNGAALSLDPALSWAGYRRAEEDMRNLHAWFDGHIRRLRANPGEDLISRLVTLEGDDELTDVELRATGLLVLGAGFETTVNLIGNGVALLAAHPEQRERLDADPSLWGRAVDEVLRFDSPVQATMRMPWADTEVLGQHVPAHTPVLLYLGGANRDPLVFDDPDTFDVGRANASSHVAFSSGAHFCLGASLARREAEVGLRSLYARFPDLRLTGPGTRRETRVLRGFEHLPVAARSRSAVA